ncbi:MAG TPA: hypothetical protein VF690_03510 [Hymenobacter sp.]
MPRARRHPAQLKFVRRRHGSVLLQELLLLAGQNQRVSGSSVFQYQAPVEWENYRPTVVESVEMCPRCTGLWTTH